MGGIICERASCKEEAFAKVAYLGKFLCREHYKELGDFDAKGKMDDKRVKR